MSFLDPLSIFMRLILIDGLYQSLWYVKSILYKQNIKQQFSRFVKKEERYAYYFLITFLVWNAKIILYTNSLYGWELLSLPPLLSMTVEHPVFKYHYLNITDYLAIKASDLCCHFLTKLINLTGIHLFQQNRNIISFEETRQIYDSTSKKTLLAIMKVIIIGFVYDVIFYYIYKMIIFNKISASKKKRYISEILIEIKKKNWKNLLTVSNISKIFSIYYETEHTWFYKKIDILKEKLWLESVRVSSYWSIMAFMALGIPQWMSCLVVLILIRRECLVLRNTPEGSATPWITPTLSEVALYSISLTILSPNYLINTIVLLYVKKIDIESVYIKREEYSQFMKGICFSAFMATFRFWGNKNEQFSPLLHMTILSILIGCYIFIWNRRKSIEEINVIGEYFSEKGEKEWGRGGDENIGKRIEMTEIDDYFSIEASSK